MLIAERRQGYCALPIAPRLLGRIARFVDHSRASVSLGTRVTQIAAHEQ